jgi:hypothetical protein
LKEIKRFSRFCARVPHIRSDRRSRTLAVVFRQSAPAGRAYKSPSAHQTFDLVEAARAQGPRFSHVWKPDLDAPTASQSHATGQTERCFAMKLNFMSTPSQSRLRPFLRHVAIRLELCDLTPEPVALRLHTVEP